MLIAFDWKYVDDMLERLTEAQAGTLSGGSITSETRKQVFDLDQVGNWTHTDLITGGSTTEFDWDFTHNKVNEITGWDNQTNNVAPTYDAAGNMTDDKRDWKYEYDAWYRLVRVRDQSDNVKAEYKYNGLGFRISARYDESNPWQHFAYDERWRIMAMYEDDADASEPTEQFWYHNAGASGLGGSSYIDAVVLRDRDTDANGTLDERHHYLQNQHHDVVALISTSGSISERVNYDPYGSPIGTFTSIANRKGYAGYEYDEKISTGGAAGSHTYHVRHRIYRSDLGVWTRRDPLGYVDGMGLYEYVNGHPLTSHDALGLASDECYNQSNPAPNCESIREGIDQCDSEFSECMNDCIRNIHDPYGYGWMGCLSNCEAKRAACYGRTIDRAYPRGTRSCLPLSSDSPCCDEYDPSDLYWGANAQCFCKCAGDSDWSRLVRGCLRCLYSCGIPAHKAHEGCYAFADSRDLKRPNWTLAWCYALCGHPGRWLPGDPPGVARPQSEVILVQ